MNIDKNQIIELLKKRGDHDQARQAESELPEKVDPEKDSGLLSKFGINAQDLLGGGAGGIKGKLGI